ncbi:MAG: putative exported protein of unknown function [Proteobacteria bacterium]|nr:putative exported protein of unknown function [Pseudomonadota bacterium]
MLLLSACASAPMERGQTLSSYEGMAASDGILTKSFLRGNKDKLLAAKTIQVIPTLFSNTAGPTLSAEQRALVSNTIDRSLCIGLSERFQVVSAGTAADLTVRASVVHSAATSQVAAGASKVASALPTVLGVPGMVPRIPIGLGSLTVEGEAVDGIGQQQAAILWGRGANSLTSPAKISKIGDAYDLATSFGDDFSRLLVTGESPFESMGSTPSMQKIGTSLGGRPKYAACEAFGRDPGVVGFAAGVMGLPPEWSDTGAKPTPVQSP